MTTYDPRFTASRDTERFTITRIRDNFSVFLYGVDADLAEAALERVRDDREVADVEAQTWFDEFAEKRTLHHIDCLPVGWVDVVYDPSDYTVAVEATLSGDTHGYQPFQYSDGNVLLDRAYEPMREAILEAFKLAKPHQDRLRFAELPPHFKVAVRDVTAHCDQDWVKEMEIESVEEVWLFDDARRVHIASFSASVEGHYVTQRVTVRGLYDDETPDAERDRLERLRDRAENELNPPDSCVDYFGGLSADYDFGPLENHVIRDLVTGETDYDDVIEGFIDYCRSNEVA